MSSAVTSRTNDDWLAAMRAQDPRALDALRAYLCQALQKALAGRPGQSDVEDFAQQALQKILESLDTFRGDSRFTTWAAAVAIRVAFTELRRKRWGNVSLDALLAQGGGPDGAAFGAPADSMQKTARGELLDALRQAIAEALTERQRTLVLAELRGMPAAVICEEMGMKPGAAYKMYHDARKKLRKYLEERGISVDDVRFSLDTTSKNHD